MNQNFVSYGLDSKTFGPIGFWKNLKTSNDLNQKFNN